MKLTCLATNSSEAYQRPVLPNPLQVSVLIDPENPLHFDLGSSSDEDEGGEPDERPAATPAAARASLGAEEAATHCEGGEGSEATLALASGAPKATAEGVAVQRGGTRTRASQAVRSRPKARGGDDCTEAPRRQRKRARRRRRTTSTRMRQRSSRAAPPPRMTR